MSDRSFWVPANPAAIDRLVVIGDASRTNPGAGTLRYLRLRVHLAEYELAGEAADAATRQGWVRLFANGHGREAMMDAFGALAAGIDGGDSRRQLVKEFSEFLGTLPGDRLQRFAAAMAGGGHRSFLDRQLILDGVRAVLTADAGTGPARAIPPLIAAVFLCHAIASVREAEARPDDESVVAGFPAGLAMDIVRGQAFQDEDEPFFALDRTLRLWMDYGHLAAPLLGGGQAAELFRTATGVEVQDFVALGFSLFAHFAAWHPGDLIRVDSDLGPGVDELVRERFLKAVTIAVEDLADAMSSSEGRWDYLVVQKHPVVQVGDGFVVIDGKFLADRFTVGLFHDVAASLAEREGESAVLAWRQAWGKMVEAMVEDNLRAQAPRSLAEAQVYFTEFDVAYAYRPHSRPGAAGCADAVLDYGDVVVVIEIVSGTLTNATRIGGDIQAFELDMEKIAYKKIRQLDDTVRAIRSDPGSLLPGRSADPIIQPVVVAGGGFPLSPVTARKIEEYREQNGLLHDTRPLAVVSAQEVEMVEGLTNRGFTLPGLIDRWKSSDLAHISFRNYVLEQIPWDPVLYRAPRLHRRLASLSENIRRVLGERPGNGEADP